MVIFWGGLFLFVCTVHASAANDDFRLAIVDLNWRKQEMIAAHSKSSCTRPLHEQLHATVADDTSSRLAESLNSHRWLASATAAIDAAVGICEWGHEIEGLSVFGVRLGHQVLTSVAVVTAGQIVLFSQLVLRYFEVGMVATLDP